MGTFPGVVTVLRGRGTLASPERVVAHLDDGTEQVLEADAVLVATGVRPRTLPTAQPDGERILIGSRSTTSPRSPPSASSSGPA